MLMFSKPVRVLTCQRRFVLPREIAQKIFYTSNLQGLTIQQYQNKNSKIQVQNKTQTLRKSDTFLSKAGRHGEDINVNNKTEHKNTVNIWGIKGFKENSRLLKQKNVLKVNIYEKSTSVYTKK